MKAFVMFTRTVFEEVWIEVDADESLPKNGWLDDAAEKASVKVKLKMADDWKRTSQTAPEVRIIRRGDAGE